MSPKTKFNLLLEPEQLAALREIQTITGATVAEQIRRAIADWIAKRGALPPDPVYAELQKLAAMPSPADPAKRRVLATVRNAERLHRQTLSHNRELEAIKHGERTDEEAERVLAKALKAKTARRRAGTRKRA